jgi:hypothetical protein
MRRAKLAILLLVTAAAAPASARASETVSVRVRPGVMVCAGLCPWFEARVTPRGRVTVRHFELSDDVEGAVVVRRAESFHASPRRAAAFRALLRPLRPARNREADASCPPIRQQDGAPDSIDMSRKDDILIIWRGGGRSTRLTACLGNRTVDHAAQRAVAALGLFPSGSHPGREQ